MNATHALGWALVHFLWQGAALAILLGVALRVIRPAAARTRYTVSIITLGAMLAAPVATTLRLYEPTVSSLSQTSVPADPASDVNAPAPRAASPAVKSLQSLFSPAPAPGPAPAHSDNRVARFTQWGDRLEPVLPWLVVVWVLGVLILSVRLAYGWMAARRLRTHGTRDVSTSLQHVLTRLAARLHVHRPVRLLESLLLEVPAVIGWLRPVVLVPASALTGLTPQQLEVLLAHELAHVRRYDYLVNVIQCVIETLLFYHPAVWWVSRRIREEREHCCDDLVVEVCGDPHLYATALVGMEHIRATTPRLALAATGGGGSLLKRVRRLLLPSAPRAEYFPRWAAGIAGMLAVTIALLTTGSDRLSGEPATDLVADTTRAAPDTVLRHPDASQPLAQRWDWARTQARQLNRRMYWVGYTIKRPSWLEHSVYVDRGLEVTGQNITMSGRLFGDFQGFMFRGVRLARLTGSDDSDDIVILFGFRTDQSGKVALSHVHVASFYLPMDFRGRTLLWLGDATDAQSVPIVEALFTPTPQPELREDVVAAIGIHGSSDLVVPILLRWLTGREPTDVRQQAAEWLGFHPTPTAVAALSAAARNDQSGDVRRGAAEALGDNMLPAATESTIAVARTAGDPDARRAAVEGLGQKESDRALTTLVSIAQSDRDEDVQRAAVETLGEMPNGRGLNAVRDIARSHPRPDVRRAAVETLGENLEPAEAITLLKDIATRDPNADVRRQAVETLGQHAPTAETVRFLATLASRAEEDVARQAVETLGEIGDLGLPAVIEIARTHPNADLRRAAVETIADKAAPAQALDILAQIARRDTDSDVQRAAVETLGKLRDDRAYGLLVDFARTHPVSDVRRAAIETLGESGRPDSVIDILGGVARTADDPDVARAAVETLGEMHDTRARALVARIARGSGNVEVRRHAIETYGESAPSDSALALLKSILASDAPEDVYSAVLEALEGMEAGAGIPALIDAARSHPNREVRADALRRLAESDDPRAQRLFEQTLRRP
jgi:HEAT repeat protein/beta-lactamase regulating signal transducer with metallopeptidase domain